MLRIALLSSLVCPSLLCLMLGSEMTRAAELYRWTEADGSITFSPTPPAAGTAYETVGGNEPDRAPDDVPVAPALGAATRSSAPTASPTAGSSATSADAPTLGTLRWHDPGNSGESEQRPDQSAARRTEPSRQDRTDALLVRADGKDRHCDDLAKRVVSLERRLATRLTAAQMDDTVVYMARYQHNIDQFCSR